MSAPLASGLPVLVDEDVWPDFGEVIAGLGGSWTAPSGREYVLSLTGRRLEVALRMSALSAPPTGDEIDQDLLELACLVQDRVPGEWSGDGLRRVAQVWGWTLPS